MLPLTPLLLVTSLCTADAPSPADSLETLFRSGRPFAEFLEAAEARRELWLKNWERSAVPEALIERARATGTWHILVVAEDRCSDSASTLPYLARLVESAPNLELRIVNSTAGRALMEAHRTPDGRAATPTFILLDPAFEKRGCWVERPSELQSWWIENAAMSNEERVRQKMEWYEADRGQSTVVEVVEMIERAAAGHLACPAG